MSKLFDISYFEHNLDLDNGKEDDKITVHRKGCLNKLVKLFP